MRFFDFEDETERLPARVHMQLLDLIRALTRNPGMQLEFGPHALYDESRLRVTVSTFWERFDENDRNVGMKTDVYLRCIGNARFSDANAAREFLARPYLYRSFAKQLFALCEDTRLERVCRSIRPGTVRAFDVRRNRFLAYAREKADYHMTAGHLADALLLAAYQQLTAHPHDTRTSPAFDRHFTDVLDALCLDVNRSESTSDITDACNRYLQAVIPHLPADAVALYFDTSEYNATSQPMETSDTFSQLVRTNKLDSDVAEPAKLSEDANRADEETEIWHRETKGDSANLLQMNVEHGTMSEERGDSWREGSDEAARVSDIVQGPSQSAASQQTDEGAGPSSRVGGSTNQPENAKAGMQRARHRFLPTAVPSDGDKAAYAELAYKAAPLQRKLKHVIEAHIERKPLHRREGLLAGRLGRNLVRVVVAPTPRLFHKKDSAERELDAAFLLLVDCSGSMFDRMDETRLGVTLFHETLKSLRVPHSVVGFWEDTEGVGAETSVTLFEPVISFRNGLKPSAGPTIARMEAHLDNRDGYAIRTMTKELLFRSERRKVMIVFSDGEPAAMDYEGNGVFDTHQAVLEAERQGVQVVNIFFTDGHHAVAAERAIRDIYGNGAITIPHVDDLPEIMSGVLRKLLIHQVP